MKISAKWHLKTGGVKQALQKYLAQAAFLGMLFQGMPGSALAEARGQEVLLRPFTIEQSTIQFSTDDSDPLRLADTQPIKIALVESRVDKELRLAKAAQRTRPTRRAAAQSDPDLTVKRALVQRAAAAYGIPWEILEAVWQVESGKSWDTEVRSYAGAQGPAQFMPGTWRRYGVDGDGDGQTNIHSAVDAVYGAANYLATSGASRGEVYRALFAYNHADWYVQKVLGVARDIGYQG